MKTKTTRLHTIALGILFLTGIAQAETTPQPTLEQRLAIVERKIEIAQEEAAAKAKDGSGVVANKGFQLKSNDGNFVLKITGYVQTDYRDYLSDADGSTDQFLLRRVRPSIEGTINKVVDFRVLPDFANGGGTANSTVASGPGSVTGGTAVTGSLLQDAYVELKTFPLAKVRVGKFKSPFSLERLQSGTALNFVERAFPTSLAGNRDVGVQLGGDSANGVFAYQAGVFNGTVDGGSGESDITDGKDYVGRLFVHPFKKSPNFLQGLGIGIAGSVGEQRGTIASSQLPTYRTAGQQAFFSYASNVHAFGDRNRISPQGYWYHNNKSLFGEYTISEQDVRLGTTTATAGVHSIANRGWVVAGTWVLTGEKTSFRGVKPNKAFDPKKGGWGAIELAARYSELRVDNKAFQKNLASLATSARRAKEWTGGVNWYLNDAVKVVSNYAYTSFERGATVGNRRTERVVLTRVQLGY